MESDILSPDTLAQNKAALLRVARDGYAPEKHCPIPDKHRLLPATLQLINESMPRDIVTMRNMLVYLCFLDDLSVRFRLARHFAYAASTDDQWNHLRSSLVSVLQNFAPASIPEQCAYQDIFSLLWNEQHDTASMWWRVKRWYKYRTTDFLFIIQNLITFEEMVGVVKMTVHQQFKAR